MLDRADTKKLFSLKMLDEAGREKLLNSISKAGGAGMKKLFSLKMLGNILAKKPV